MATLAMSSSEPLTKRASCGGALVAPDKVVTAAHCVAGLPPQAVGTLEYHVGARTLSSEPGHTARIRSVATAPGYRILPSPVAPQSQELSSATHDVAVVTLEAPVPDAAPLPLGAAAPAAGQDATLYGHGITSADSGTTDALKEIPYRIDAAAGCAPETPAPVDVTSMVCGRGTSAAFACFGDSGGPLVRRAADGREELVGVMSFGMETAGKPCGTPGPNFFTGLTADRAWLDTQVRTR
jgi:secreted trypsin-like serine protease